MTTKRYARVREPDGKTSWALVRGDVLDVLDAAPWDGGKPTARSISRADARLLAAAAPSKIVCVGRNYGAHARELGHEIPKEPLLFLKPPSSILDPGGSVVLPPESERVEHEAELALVIGERGRRIPIERALDHVFGYLVACDVTARDLQNKDGQWTRAKGFDTFCPLGPELARGVDPRALSIRLAVDGEVRQSGTTADMLFDLARIVAHISNVMTLEPGDLVLTGTPEGVGPLRAGNRVLVEIDELAPLGFDVAS